MAKRDDIPRAEPCDEHGEDAWLWEELLGDDRLPTDRPGETLAEALARVLAEQEPEE